MDSGEQSNPCPTWGCSRDATLSSGDGGTPGFHPLLGEASAQQPQEVTMEYQWNTIPCDILRGVLPQGVGVVFWGIPGSWRCSPSGHHPVVTTTRDALHQVPHAMATTSGRRRTRRRRRNPSHQLGRMVALQSCWWPPWWQEQKPLPVLRGTKWARGLSQGPQCPPSRGGVSWWASPSPRGSLQVRCQLGRPTGAFQPGGPHPTATREGTPGDVTPHLAPRLGDPGHLKPSN